MKRDRNWSVELDAVAVAVVRVRAADQHTAAQLGSERIADVMHDAERLLEEHGIPITLVEGDAWPTVEQEADDEL
jgi:hypothetical protein